MSLFVKLSYKRNYLQRNKPFKFNKNRKNLEAQYLNLSPNNSTITQLANLYAYLCSGT